MKKEINIRGHKLLKWGTIIAMASVLVVAFYIMLKGLGLQDSLDFGAGAYFYADIPDFDKYTEKAALETALPYWLYVILFLLWGGLMYFLWSWIDRRGR